MLSSVELRRRRQQHQHHASVTAGRLAEFLNSVEADEAVALQRLRAAATKKATRRKGGRAGGAPPPQATTLQEPQVSSESLRLTEYTARPDLLEVYEEYQ